MGQVTVPFIEIPVGAMPGTNRADTYRSLVATALKLGLPPQRLDLNGVARQSIFLPPLLQEKILATAKEHNMTLQEAFAGFTQAGLDHVLAKRVRHHISAIGISVPFEKPRPEQARFYQAIMSSLNAGRICAAEASTGVGKGRALVAAAFETARAGKAPVVIAAPTLKVLGQLWSEKEALQKEGVGQLVPCGFYPGATEFVDANRLRDYLREVAADKGAEAADPAVLQWVEAGGPVRSTSPLTRAMNEAQVPLAFLMDDLRDLATELVPSDFALRGIEDTAASECLVAVRKETAMAQVIFCTHAMLARAHQSAWKNFPAPQVLIIDEAHQFEQILASIYSDSLSLFSLRHRLRLYRKEMGLGSSSKVAAAYKHVQSLIERFKEFDATRSGSGRNIRLLPGEDDLSPLLASLEGLQGLLKAKTLNEVKGIKGDRDTLRRAVAVLSGQAFERVYLEFSPDRRFPSLVAGRGSVGAIMGDLWRTAEGGVALASATLYIPDEFGNQKCDYLAEILSLPLSRLDTPMPIRAEWVTSQPILHVPEPMLAARLARPRANERAEASESGWLDELARAVSCIASQAAGGTLVLTTSYAQSRGLTERLLKLGISLERIVQQQPNIKFEVAEKNFREKHRLGLRPILFGLGMAWTGLDLRDDVPAEEDMLLTDLVIACCPLGLNRTSTMLARIERTAVNPIIKEALMMLRQGLGRIIRDEKMKGRHIWFLDGRVWSDWKGMQGFCVSARKLLEGYQKRSEFSA